MIMTMYKLYIVKSCKNILSFQCIFIIFNSSNVQKQKQKIHFFFIPCKTFFSLVIQVSEIMKYLPVFTFIST